MSGWCGRYSPEFRELAVGLAMRSAQPLADVVHEPGDGRTTLHTWVSAARRGPAARQAEPEAKDRMSLKRENETRKTQREALLQVLVMRAGECR